MRLTAPRTNPKHTMTFIDTTGSFQAREFDCDSTNTVYKAIQKPIFFKIINNPNLLITELFASILMEKMIRIINDHPNELQDHQKKRTRIRTPSPRACTSSPTNSSQHYQSAIASPSIKDDSTIYDDLGSFGAQKLASLDKEIIQIAVMRQLIQDADAFTQNMETDREAQELLTLDYGYAFYGSTGEQQSNKRTLPDQFINPKSKEEILASLLFDKTDHSDKCTDTHCLLQESVIRTSTTVKADTVFQTLHTLSCIQYSDILSWQSQTLKNILTNHLQILKSSTVESIRLQPELLSITCNLLKTGDNETKRLCYQTLLETMSSKSFRKTPTGKIYKHFIRYVLTLVSPPIEEPLLQSYRAKLSNLVVREHSNEPDETRSLKQSFRTIETILDEASHIFSYRLYLAKALFQGNKIHINFDKLREIYTTWQRQYSYDPKSEKEEERITEETTRWINSISDSVEKFNGAQRVLLLDSPRQACSQTLFRSISPNGLTGRQLEAQIGFETSM